MDSSVNATLQDRAIRHAVMVGRYGEHQAQAIAKVLAEDVIPDLATELEKRLAKVAKLGMDPGPATTRRLQALLAGTSTIVQQFTSGALKDLTPKLEDLAEHEAAWQAGELATFTAPVGWETVLPSPATLQAAVFSSPMDGHLLGEWFGKLEASTKAELARAVRIGAIEGQTIPQISKRVRQALGNVTRRQAETVARTAVLHTSNQARQATYAGNEDLIKGVQWIATLDTRTCVRCGGLDGKVFPVDQGGRPPAHHGCRCTHSPVLKSWKELGIEANELPEGTRASMNGQVARSLKYPEWLKQQPPAIQDAVLGAKKAALFRSGALDLNSFVDNGRTLSLEALQEAEPAAFAGALGLPARKAAKAAQRAQDNAQTALHAESQAQLDKLAAGEGKFLQVTAIKQLQKTGELEGLNPTEALQKVADHATFLQAQKHQASKLSQAKAKLLAGKTPSPVEQAAIDNLPDDAKQAFLAQIHQQTKVGPALEELAGVKQLADDHGLSDLVKAIDLETDPVAAIAKFKPLVEAEAAAKKEWLGKFGMAEPGSVEHQALEGAKGVKGSWQLQLKAANGELEYLLKKQAEKAAAEQAAALAKAQATLDQVASTPLGKKVLATIDTSDPLAAAAQAETKLAAETAANKTLASKFISSAPGSAEDTVLNQSLDLLPKAALPSEHLAILNAELEKHLKALADAAAKAQSEAQAAIDAIAAGQGTTLQQTALKQLQKAGELTGTPAQNLEKLQATAAVLQAAKSKAKALSSIKAKMIAGKPLSPGEKAVFDNLVPEEKQFVAEAINAELTKAAAKAEASNPTANLAKSAAKVEEPDPIATPPVGELRGEDLAYWKPKESGSVPGYWAKDQNGVAWLVKLPPAGEDVVRNEVLAGQLYKAAGVAVPELRIARFTDGRVGVASRGVDGFAEDRKLFEAGKRVAGAQENIAVDAWLGNWDVAGASFDNIGIANGQAVRIDVGGSLRYRAQGGLKGKLWSADVAELETLRDPTVNRQTTALFAKLTQADLDAGVRRVLSVSDETIQSLVEQFGPTDKATAGELVKTLIARRETLAKRFPHLVDAKPAKPAIDAGARVTKGEIQRVEEARLNGYAFNTDAGDIEDQTVLVWHEKDQAGKARTAGYLKVRGEAATKLTATLPKGAMKAEAHHAPEAQGAASQANDAVLTAIKGIGKQAATGQTIRAQDVQRVAAARVQLERARSAIASAVSKGQTTKAALEEFDAHFTPWLKALEDAIAKGDGSPATWQPPGSAFSGWSVPAPPAAKKAAQSEGIAWKRVDDFEAKSIERGFAKVTGPMGFGIHGAGHFEAVIDGIMVRYWPDTSDTLTALRGRLEIVSAGSDEAAAAKVFATLDKLGINSTRSTALDQEELYLTQIAYHAKAKWEEFKPLQAIASQAERVEAMRAHVAKALKVKKLADLPGYRPAGQLQAFDQGYVHRYRPDLAGTEWEQFQESYRLHHSITNGTMLDNLKLILNSGGQMAPTTDKLRRGIRPGGMSPTQDLSTGGASYFFTRIKTAADARQQQGLVWKSRLVARLDAISYDSDKYGRTDSEAFVLQNRKTGISQWKNAAKHGGNETILKNSLSLFDDVDVIVVSRSEQAAAIKLFRDAGFKTWPDGRPLEEVIITSRY